MGEREELLAALRARLERAATTGDPAAILAAPARAEAHRLARYLERDPDAAGVLESAITLGRLHHQRALALPPAVADQDRRAAVRFLAAGFIVEMDGLPSELLPSLAEAAIPFAEEQLARLKSSEQPADYTRVVGLFRHILKSLPEDHRFRALCLSYLSLALSGQYLSTSAVEDLREAVELARAAVRSAPSGSVQMVTYLNNLGVVLRGWFDRSRVLADLDEAVDALRTALRMSPGHAPHRTEMLYQLGLDLGSRYEVTGALADVDEEIDLIRGAVRATADGNPDRARYLSALGGALLLRHERTRVPEDVDEAVEATRAANRAVSHPAPHARSLRLGGLGLALMARYQHTRALPDIDEAVETLRAAVRAIPDNSFFPGLSDEEVHQLNFVLSLLNGNGQLDEAIDVLGAANRNGDPERAMGLFNLGSALLTRFDHTEAPTDLDEAAEMMHAAARRFPDDHILKATALVHLGRALHKRFTRDGVAEDREKALRIFLTLAETETTPPRIRVASARAGAGLVASSDSARAAQLLEGAVRLLPEVAPRRLRRGDQQDAIGRLSTGLAADAAALALADTSVGPTARAARALQLAEAGRAVLLSQTLDIRSDVTDLHDRHIDLAERFLELRSVLDQDSAPPLSAADGAEGPGPERHHLAREMEALLRRIRSCEGFTDFGLPPTVGGLMAEAEHGPVVTFNISRYRSDALLLTGRGISSCALPGLTPDTLIRQVLLFYGALDDAASPDGKRRMAAQRALRKVLEWLWEAALEPVLSALEALGEAIPPAHDQSPPRVWWAPGGLLGLLPLHAAGFHTDPEGPRRRTVLDRVISSYTPTIRALRHARGQRPRPDGQSLIVSMPTTPGHSPLRYAQEEARRVERLLPCPVQLTEPAPAPDGASPSASADTPTTTAVLTRLPHCAIAHFACHGASNHTDPSQSRLLLHDHAATPLTVSVLAQTPLAHAQLAYLSACSTADPGSPELLDEAIHLTSAFQLAGFPHVVGTLWPIDDRLAAEIAESFYTHLARDPSGELDPAGAATALHHTIRGMRDRYPATPSLWAAHLHAGA
ncbi:CHAT domain-containing tetratricopeptide repeat protein [Streptomyces mangrovisoli]|uniref:CHAT domain-containing protein n=1 Tax=Streptomyces mangrovisoli TaxID=1428628 RepID=A0A1J4NWK5_9ACTN|nr:CHAT domain-containing protein [Streptomyces mangrovisoli]OIJ66466.1 hypothetical protein WN71_018315 [Streptomyces mangrovisoli]